MAESKTKTAETAVVHFPAPTSKEEPNYVIVGFNGKIYKIKKGEDVEVPAVVAEIIKNSEKEKDEIAKRMLERAM